MPHMKISVGSYKARENGDRLHRIPKVLVYSGILFHTFCIDMPDNENKKSFNWSI